MTATDDGMALRAAEALGFRVDDEEGFATPLIWLHPQKYVRPEALYTTGDGMLALLNALEKRDWGEFALRIRLDWADGWDVDLGLENRYASKQLAYTAAPDLPLAVLRAAAAALGVAEGGEE